MKQTRSAFSLSMKGIGTVMALAVLTLLGLAYAADGEDDAECGSHRVRAEVETGGVETLVGWVLGDDSGTEETARNWSREVTVRCDESVALRGAGGDPVCKMFLDGWEWAVREAVEGVCTLTLLTP